MSKASFERLAAQLGRLEDDEPCASGREEAKPALTAAQRLLKAWEAKEYFRYVEGACICSRGGRDIAAGSCEG